MIDTERRIDEEKKSIILKKQAIDNETRVIQDRLGSTMPRENIHEAYAQELDQGLPSTRTRRPL